MCQEYIPDFRQLVGEYLAARGHGGLTLRLPRPAPLSFHVDYWNYLGGKDPFSRSEYTDRQQAYARTLSGRVYTPQLVLNGVEAFVGSDARRARASVAAAVARETGASLTVPARWKDSDWAVTLEVAVTGARPSKGFLAKRLRPCASSGGG